MQKILFNVKSRPSKKTVGRTDVINRVFGENDMFTDTVIGKLRKVRGASGYTAFVLDATAAGGRVELEGDFGTRSKAGHAVQRASQSEARAEKVAKRAATAQAAVDKKAAKVAAKVTADADAAAAKVTASA